LVFTLFTNNIDYLFTEVCDNNAAKWLTQTLTYT